MEHRLRKSWDDDRGAWIATEWVFVATILVLVAVVGLVAVRQAVASELTDFVKTRKGYDYKDHSRVGAAHGAFVTDEICDRFCVIGDAEACSAKLRELEGVGVDQFNIYLMTNGQEEVLEAYGQQIIPGFQGVAGSSRKSSRTPCDSLRLRTGLKAFTTASGTTMVRLQELIA